MNKIPQEIERKYLIREGSSEYATEALYRLYPSIGALKENVLAHGELIRQGYIPIEKGMDLVYKLGLKVDFKVEEARLRDKAGKLYFTLKGGGDILRNEIEAEITKELFDEYWPRTKGKRVEKVRLERPYEGHTIEIDVYADRDLIIAEVEAPIAKQVEKLHPVGLDVTTNKKYKNKNLAK